MSINEIVSAIESLTLIECSELVKALEEKFGVVAAAPVAAGAGAAAELAVGRCAGVPSGPLAVGGRLQRHSLRRIGLAYQLIIL